MSVFVLKLLAVVSMFIDHLTYVLYLSGHIPYGTLYIVGRAIGRPAFLVYCFLLVNGFEKTRDRKKYLARLIEFAVISQIPFSLAFTRDNFRAANSNCGMLFSIDAQKALILLLPLAVYFIVVCECRAKPSLFWLAAAFFASSATLTVRGITLLSADTNVFYTLAAGMALMLSADFAVSERRSWWKLLLIAAALGVELYFVQVDSDYGILGAAIIFLLYLTRRWRPVQVMVVALSSLAEYYWSVPYFAAALTALIPILLYNGKLGPKMRSAFYIFYPAHLALLGAVFIALSRLKG